MAASVHFFGDVPVYAYQQTISRAFERFEEIEAEKGRDFVEQCFFLAENTVKSVFFWLNQDRDTVEKRFLSFHVGG